MEHNSASESVGVDHLLEFDLGPTDTEFKRRMSKDCFGHIVPAMFHSDKRSNKRFVEMLRQTILITQFPTLDDIFQTSTYTPKTIRSRKSSLKKSKYFTDDRLNRMFYDDYYSQFAIYYDMMEDMSVSINDSSGLDEVTLSPLFTHSEVTKILNSNVNLKFAFPSTHKVANLDFMDNKVQFVKFNHIGINTSVPYPINFYYVCSGCKSIHRFPTVPTSKRCPFPNCNGTLVRKEEKDSVVRVFASQISEVSGTIPAISLVEIPNGEFTAAVLICRDEQNTRYSVFILAIEEKSYETMPFIVNRDEHAIWQMIERIDALHEERMNFHIHGMDYYKAAILMMMVANFSDFTSYNILIAGKSGGAKTVTPKWYFNTISLACKIQDVVSVSMPGLVGSSSDIQVNNRSIRINEPGLLSRYEFVVLDEFYNKTEVRLIGQLKGSLSSPTISKEVHGNRSEIKKTASVVATANIAHAVYNSSRQKYDDYLRIYRADPDTYANYDAHTEKAVNDNLFDTDVSEIIKRTVQHMYKAEGMNWIDGQTLSDLDRFALIFYVGNPFVDKETVVPDHIFDTIDAEISTPDLQRIIFSQEIRDYLKWCSQIKIIMDADMKAKVKTFIKGLWNKDHIHSDARGMRYISKTLEISAMICGRDYITERDFDFVKDLFSRSCRWVEIDEMVQERSDKIYDEHQYDRREPADSAVKLYLDECCVHFDLWGEGFKDYDNVVKNIGFKLMGEFHMDDPAIVQRNLDLYLAAHPHGENGNAGNIPSDECYVLPEQNNNPPVLSCYTSGEDGQLLRDFYDSILEKHRRGNTIMKVDLGAVCLAEGIDQSEMDAHLSHMCKHHMMMEKNTCYKWLK